MTIREIMVPLTGTDADPVALATALTVAAAFGAHVDALFASPSHDATSGLTHPRVAAARRHFDAACAAARVPIAEPAPGGPSAGWRELAGDPDAIAREGRLADLLVFAHPVAGDDEQLDLIRVTALLDAGRPLLLAPAAAPASLGRTVAIAWNGSTEAVRAVTGALPFLERAEAVHLLTAETGGGGADEGRRLAEYLARHGVAAGVTVLEPADRPAAVAEALLGKATELGCDLLVMGGYGHGRVRELILGGVTRHVLAHAALPVLLAH